jgi:hypothetical protein
LHHSDTPSEGLDTSDTLLLTCSFRLGTVALAVKPLDCLAITIWGSISALPRNNDATMTRDHGLHATRRFSKGSDKSPVPMLDNDRFPFCQINIPWRFRAFLVFCFFFFGFPS